MAELVTVARPYAKAAYAFAKEHNATAEWSQMLAFTAAVVLDQNIQNVLDNPQLTAEKQADIFVDICSDKLSGDAQNFVRQMAANKRLQALADVAELYEVFLAEDQKKEDVLVTSAYELSETETASLQQALALKLGKEISISTVVDKSLIGGAVIQAGDMVIDSSVRGKVAQLSQTLN